MRSASRLNDNLSTSVCEFFSLLYGVILALIVQSFCEQLLNPEAWWTQSQCPTQRVIYLIIEVGVLLIFCILDWLYVVAYLKNVPRGNQYYQQFQKLPPPNKIGTAFINMCYLFSYAVMTFVFLSHNFQHCEWYKLPSIWLASTFIFMLIWRWFFWGKEVFRGILRTFETMCLLSILILSFKYSKCEAFWFSTCLFTTVWLSSSYYMKIYQRRR